MKCNVLLVFNRKKGDLVDAIKYVFKEQVLIDGLDGVIDWDTNLADARHRLDMGRQNYDLLVVDLYAPADSKDATRTEDQKGFEWIREMHAQGLNLPSILVTPALDELLSHKASKMKACQTISLGGHFSDLLAEKSADILRGQATRSGISLELEITITDSSLQPEFKLHGNIDKEVIDRKGALEIDREIISDLRDRCNRNIPNLQTGWEEELKGIGKNLFKELFEKNYKLRNALDKFMAKIDPEKQFKFRFKVGKKVHSLVLEALFEAQKDFFWMLRYPICRQIVFSGDYHELSIGRPDRRERINCLIINSDVHEYVQEIGRTFGQLLNIEKEATFLEELLRDNKEALHIGKVQRIDGPHQDATFSDTIRQLLSREKYHLVHYAGHSYFDAREMKGYLVLPGNDYPEVLDIEKFSAWLRKAKTQFIFLSSCHSSEEDFVFELASKKIPAILGFRWDLDDERAYEYAQSFYRQLFEKRNPLEYALLEARKEMYDIDPQDRIWAAPMLVLQTSER